MSVLYLYIAARFLTNASFSYLVTIPVELRVYSSITELNFG